MRHSSTKETIGLTWTADGACRGVRLRVGVDGAAVAGFWGGPEDAGESISARLQEAARILSVSERTTVVAGGIGDGSGFADVPVPDAPPDELRSMLGFELRKHAAVPPDQTVWGYRALSAAGSGRTARLVYVHEDAWHRWLDHVGGIQTGVDAVLPPAAALDPVLSENDVALTDRNKPARYGLVRAGDGRREVRPLPEDESRVFGAGAAPLNLPNLQLGGLAALPPDEQRTYAGAVILALYGAGGTLREDRKTGLPLPAELKPRRHELARRLAACLAVYLAGLLLFIGGRYYVEARAVLMNLKTELAETESRIDAITTGEDGAEFVKSLSQDVESLGLDRPVMTACLLELTELLSDEYWVQNMQWNDGKIELEVHTAVDDLSFVADLERSALFVDVVPVRKIVDNDNNLVVTVQLHAATRGGYEDDPAVADGGLR